MGEGEGLTIAMPKGRIFGEGIQLLRKGGVHLPESLEPDSRKLTITAVEVGLSFLMVKPMDVSTYVEHGAADLGIVGKDVLLEEDRDVYELLDLCISPCRMSVAGLPDWSPVLHPKVATKYPRIASQYFREKGQQVEVIKLNGSVELAPLIGLADRIVDIVSTGRTLKENGLVELEPIVDVTSRLIANRASYRLKGAAIDNLSDRLASVVNQKGETQHDACGETG